jgi:sarcosine oxidase subunit beta
MRQASVVVIGGGVAGTSAAYHLASMGCKDVVLIEKSAVGSGSTSKSDSIVERQFVNEFDILLRVESFKILEFFFKNRGVEFTPIGYMRLYSDPSHAERYRLSVDIQRRLGIKDVALLEPHQVKAMLPFVDTRDICGALYCASDGVTNGSELAWAFANEATKMGATVLQGTEAQKIVCFDERNGFTVVTNRGELKCDYVVNAAGPWADQVAKMCGLSVPVKPVRRQIAHFRFPTQKNWRLPFIIDMKSRLYLHGSSKEGGIYAGIHRDAYSEEKASDPESYEPGVDFQFVENISAAITARAPGLKRLEFKDGWAGLYEVTPDSRPILGEHPQLANFVNCVGFSGYGIQLAPVAGKLVAEIIVEGKASTVRDISHLKMQRFKDKVSYSLF